MSAAPRRARVRALAKLNLGLKVLNRRPDGYHELRTVFQTISLGDTMELEFAPGRGTGIELSCRPEIPDNLAARAARLAMEAFGIRGRLALRLTKRIPLGGGLGGGSSDAAAVLLALPVLAGKRAGLGTLIELASRLGSDVPFFLLGGTAVAVGRGTELYPLPDPPSSQGLIVIPPVRVSTPEAYRALGRELTEAPGSRTISSFQELVWRLGCRPPQGWSAEPLENDFETVVYARHPRLKSARRKLKKLGARPASLTGSGAALFGLFPSRREAAAAAAAFAGAEVSVFATVSRAGYRRMWWRCLRAHLDRESWPPESRYV
jgi:4-diphosphocytidyl-2-C-methyl-D-erythritol kinase